MGILLVLIVVGVAAYLFFKINTKSGAETVRAHIFLGGLGAGSTVQEANDTAAAFDLVHMPSDLVREVMQSTRAHSKAKYEGKQLPMIVDAYRCGMRPNLPLWYRTLACLHTDVHAQANRPHVQHDVHVKPQTYDAYYDEVLSEAKRLDREPKEKLHWVEMLDDQGIKRAFADGVDPRKLAAAILEHGPPRF